MMKYWLRLAGLSIADPRGALAEVRGRGHSLSEVALAAALISALGVIFFELSLMLSAAGGDAGSVLGITSPVGAFVFQYAMIWITAVIVWIGGRMFGGTAGVDDSLLAVTWLQAVMLLVQVFQMAALLLVPPLDLLIFMAAAVLLIYLLVNFIMEIHGFTSAMAVVAGVVGGFFALALVISILMAILGIGFGGVPENV